MAEHETIHAALVAALADLTGVPKGRTANAGSYSYSYTSISDVIAETRPKLAAHGLVALQPMTPTEQGMGISTVLVHEGGETFDAGTVSFRSTGDPQDDGGAITYYRRYALLSALGMAAEDDDGASASKPPAEPATGITSKTMGDIIAELLAAFEVPDEDQAHAKAIWKKATPKKAEDGLIYETEQARVTQIAEDYIAALTTDAPADPDEEPF